MADDASRQRVDRWLYFARVVKSRSLAARLVADGRVRVNRIRIDRPAQPVAAGDVLTIALDRRILVYRVLQSGSRRGPASEARALYEDLSPAPAAPSADAPVAERPPGRGRPTKKERRALMKFRPE
jgi:ribosome-associated heat shock protein Hsp15